jgi:hypothetical protein
VSDAVETGTQAAIRLSGASQCRSTPIRALIAPRQTHETQRLVSDGFRQPSAGGARRRRRTAHWMRRVRQSRTYVRHAALDERPAPARRPSLGRLRMTRGCSSLPLQSVCGDAGSFRRLRDRHAEPNRVRRLPTQEWDRTTPFGRCEAVIGPPVRQRLPLLVLSGSEVVSTDPRGCVGSALATDPTGRAITAVSLVQAKQVSDVDELSDARSSSTILGRRAALLRRHRTVDHSAESLLPAARRVIKGSAKRLGYRCSDPFQRPKGSGGWWWPVATQSMPRVPLLTVVPATEVRPLRDAAPARATPARREGVSEAAESLRRW